MDDLDRRILEFEQRRYRHSGAKVCAIREEFGMSDVQFYQRVGALLRDPQADIEFPALTARLRRLVDRKAG